MNEKELVRQYQEKKPLLEALGEFVSSTIVDKLEKLLGSKEKVDKFLKIPPIPRVKELDSFISKTHLKQYKDPFNDISDLVGVRFVVLKLEDIQTVCELVESERWDYSKDRDHENEKLENPDYFAYQSDHYVVKTLSEIEYSGTKIPAGWSCEIQIRTLLQHAYAEMAHDTDYKPSIKLTKDDQKKVKRSLAKGSALIETTDDVFKELSQRLTEYSKNIDDLLKKASDIYSDVVGEEPNLPSKLGELITDHYREYLKALTTDKLRDWSSNFNWPAEEIKSKRYSSILYRDPVIILLCWLVDLHRTTMPDNWPIDSTLLENIYTMLGISTTNIF